MKEIPLTQGRVALVDDEDYEGLVKYKWHLQKSASGKQEYAYRWRNIKMHRVIMKPTPEIHIDHIDGNGLNNQKSNMRFVTIRQNGQNRRDVNKSSRYPGVTWIKRNSVWCSRIVINGKKRWLGTFHNEEDAHIAYRVAEKVLVEGCYE